MRVLICRTDATAAWEGRVRSLDGRRCWMYSDSASLRQPSDQ